MCACVRCACVRVCVFVCVRVRVRVDVCAQKETQTHSGSQMREADVRTTPEPIQPRCRCVHWLQG
jgi:hypothetical protein